VPGFHIRDALDAVAARNPDLLQKFGGHAMAAGMSLTRANFAAFAQAFDDEVRRQLTTDDLQAVVVSDGELAAQDFSLHIATQLREAGPWGQHFPEPVFDGEFFLVQQKLVGEKHLKMTLAHDAQGQNSVDAIAFNIVYGPIRRRKKFVWLINWISTNFVGIPQCSCWWIIWSWQRSSAAGSFNQI
jgi:single-stranded-DNA-specific exonuclease